MQLRGTASNAGNAGGEEDSCSAYGAAIVPVSGRARPAWIFPQRSRLRANISTENNCILGHVARLSSGRSRVPGFLAHSLFQLNEGSAAADFRVFDKQGQLVSSILFHFEVPRWRNFYLF